MKIRVTLLAYQGADKSVYDQGKDKFLCLIDPQYVEFVDEHPDILFFVTGGSERPAIHHVTPGQFYPLVAFQEQNAYAAATEVKAYLNQHAVRSVLLDYADANTPSFLQEYSRVKNGLAQLQGQQVGLIGNVSDWLIASDVASDVLQDRLGIQLKKIPWETLPTFTKMAADAELLETFSSKSSLSLEATGKICTLLQQCIRDAHLDAITVECFSLVRGHAVTACLPLALFSANGIPAGCEGDLVSAAGMMLAKAVTNQIPWMANTVHIAEEQCLFAHCTIAPNLLSRYTIDTHFETGQGTAITGEFRADEITLFRLNNQLTQAFVTTGTIVARPKYKTACRTQIEVDLPQSAVTLLREQPLGNHHLVLPGNHLSTFILACDILGINVLQ